MAVNMLLVESEGYGDAQQNSYEDMIDQMIEYGYEAGRKTADYHWLIRDVQSNPLNKWKADKNLKVAVKNLKQSSYVGKQIKNLLLRKCAGKGYACRMLTLSRIIQPLGILLGLAFYYGVLERLEELSNKEEASNLKNFILEIGEPLLDVAYEPQKLASFWTSMYSLYRKYLLKKKLINVQTFVNVIYSKFNPYAIISNITKTPSIKKLLQNK